MSAPIEVTSSRTGRQYSITLLRRYVHVSEWLGDRDNGGQRTARWFKDTHSGDWYVAESWKRPNKRKWLNAEQIAFVEAELGQPVVVA